MRLTSTQAVQLIRRLRSQGHHDLAERIRYRNCPDLYLRHHGQTWQPVEVSQ